MHIRITTFNVENLFNRYSFLDISREERGYEKFLIPVGITSLSHKEIEGKMNVAPYTLTVLQRNNTAQAILDSEPDIMAIQEVENLYTIRIFNYEYLDDYFDRMILIDGNDPRGIDVGLMIKKGFPGKVKNIRTHVDDGRKSSAVVTNYRNLPEDLTFFRDCLEVDIEVNGIVLTFLVNHLKSLSGGYQSNRLREKQAKEVAKFAKEAEQEGKYPIVLGDLNVDVDDKSTEEYKKAGDSIKDLYRLDILKDPFKGQKDNWTHFYLKKHKTGRLDYILLDKRLQVRGTEIIRKGISKKCRQYTGERYPTVGMAHTEASDHCPVSVDIEL